MSELKRFDFQHRLPQPLGDLTSFPLPEIIHSCNVEEVSGIITIRRDPVEKLIYFLEGRPVFVESDLRTETLGHYLVREGRITPIEHRLIIERMRQTGRRQGDLLIEEKLLSPHELYNALLDHVREKVITCFAWEDGTFELTLGDGWAGSILNLEIEPSRLVLDGIQRHYNRARLGPLSFLPAHARATLRSDAPEAIKKLKMDTMEARLYDLIGRGGTLAEIEATTSGDPDDILRVLFGLFLLEIIGFEEGGVPKACTIPNHTPIPQRAVEASPAPEVETGPAPKQDRSNEIMAAYLRLKDADHFTLLGIGRDTKPAEVHGIFRQLSATYSAKAVDDLPDTVREKAAELYSKLVGAYQELANPLRRRAYIERLEKGEDVPRTPSQIPKPPPEQSHRADDLLNEAKEDLSADEHEAAIAKLEEALELKKGEPLYEAWLGWAIFLSKPDRKHKLAERHLEMARRSQSSLAEPYLFMARISEHLGDTVKAMHLYRAAKEHARGNIEIAREANIGEVRTKRGRSVRVSTGTVEPEKTRDRTDSALNQDVGQLIRGLFSKDK